LSPKRRLFSSVSVCL